MSRREVENSPKFGLILRLTDRYGDTVEVEEDPSATGWLLTATTTDEETGTIDERAVVELSLDDLEWLAETARARANGVTP